MGGENSFEDYELATQIAVAERQYADVNDFHTQYVGFVEKAYLRDEE